MSVHTEIDVLEHVQLSTEDVTKITKAAKADCVKKMREFNNSFDINDVNINVDYELICRVTISPAKP